MEVDRAYMNCFQKRKGTICVRKTNLATVLKGHCHEIFVKREKAKEMF